MIIRIFYGQILTFPELLHKHRLIRIQSLPTSFVADRPYLDYSESKMLKHSLALAACILAPSTAAHCEAIWDGELIVKAVGANCGGSWAANDYANVVFRPAGLDGNGADSFLSILQRDRSYSLKVTAGGLSGAGSYSASFTKNNGQATTFASAFKDMVVTPANYNASSTTILLTGVLGKMDNVAGCYVKFTAAFVKRP